jgi:amino acid transporter
MNLLEKCRIFLLGKTLDPLNPKTRKTMLLAAFLAWIGLGADGLSSACYGPEASYLALGSHNHLALYLAIAIAFTVFIIAIGYNQIIALFPTGGGGYKVATQLLGPITGLTSGVALIVDYILTISISIASSVDAIFSLLPFGMQPWKLPLEIFLLSLLGFMNLRGIKESIKILMPVFLVFFISHCALIIYGILKKSNDLQQIIPNTLAETTHLSTNFGWVFLFAVFLRAYSLGGGTYTGIEAVSNNIQRLETPRVRTGQWTMFYMASSLAVTAGGIILLYLLWNVAPIEGQTLNAVVFNNILQGGSFNEFSPVILTIVMLSEAGLLFVAANTGYIDGPAILSNMAFDNWIPRRFRHLSSRLVTQNGIILMWLSAFFILMWTKGNVTMLVVMYSINVFITFSLSLLGLSIYWIKNKGAKNRFFKFFISIIGFTVTASILTITVSEKFTEGGWVTLVITLLLIIVCMLIKRRYTAFQKMMVRLSEEFIEEEPTEPLPALPLDPEQPTAVIFVGEYLGLGICTLNTVLTLFPNQYKNFVFLSVGEIDSQSYDPEAEEKNPHQSIQELRSKTVRLLGYFVNYCRNRNLPAVHFQTNNIDVIEGLAYLAEKMQQRYKNCVFFAGKILFEQDTWMNHWLHNHTAALVQQRLQMEGMYMMLIPVQATLPPKDS